MTPLLIIAGPCVIESLDQCLQIGSHVKGICDKLGIDYIFKASFDKANRSSNASFRGPGIDEGLKTLAAVKQQIGVSVLTDIHEPAHAAIAATVVDVLQIPAFLARQTDLLIAAAETGKRINIKKGQFMAPQEMGNAIEKIRSGRRSEVVGSGSEVGGRRSAESNSTPHPQPTTHNPQPTTPDIFLTERGTFFGYNRLVNDFTGLAVMKSFNVPVIFDITHSTQQPAAMGHQSGGNPQYSPLLARAAIATGCVDGLFLECHPDPKNAKSDAATMLDLKEVEPLLSDCQRIRSAMAI